MKNYSNKQKLPEDIYNKQRDNQQKENKLKH